MCKNEEDIGQEYATDGDLTILGLFSLFVEVSELPCRWLMVGRSCMKLM